MRFITIILFSVFLAGCSALPDIIPDMNFFDFQYGDDVVQVGDNADTVNNTTNQNISPMMMVLMIAGWVLPTPQDIVKSVANFILRLFGRKPNETS